MDDDVVFVRHTQPPRGPRQSDASDTAERAKQYLRLNAFWEREERARDEMRAATKRAQLDVQFSKVSAALEKVDASTASVLEVARESTHIAETRLARSSKLRALRDEEYEALSDPVAPAAGAAAAAGEDELGMVEGEASAFEDSMGVEGDEGAEEEEGEVSDEDFVDLVSSEEDEEPAAAARTHAPDASENEEEEVIDLLDSDDDEEPAPTAAAPGPAAGDADMASAGESDAEGEDEDGAYEVAAAANRILTDAMRNEYRGLISKPGDPEEVKKHPTHNVVMTWADFATFAPTEWLSDPCINTYMALCQDRDKAWHAGGGAGGEGMPKCLYMNCFFVTKLVHGRSGYDYGEVRRWTSARKFRALKIEYYKGITDVDKVIVPVHLGNHWTCAVLNIRDQQLEYYDSLGGVDSRVIGGLCRWLEDDYRNKYLDDSPTAEIPSEYKATEWKQVKNPEGTPMQKNGYDCGIFTVMAANYAGADREFDYIQGDVHSFLRASCALECWNQRLRPLP